MMTLAINILITGQVIKHVEHGNALLYISGICFHPNADVGRLRKPSPPCLKVSQLWVMV